MDWVQPIVKSWLSTIRKACDYKRSEFQDDADEALRFFDSHHDFMYKADYAAKYGGSSANLPSTTFRMTYNKVAEMVQLFGPFLYHRNPHRSVTPARLPDIPIESFGDPNDPLVAMRIQQLQQSQQQKQSRAGITSTLMGFYLNYTPNELDLRGHGRQAIDEALIKGMGLLWPEVYTPPGGGPKMVGSFYDSVDNLVVDPDMENMLYAKYVARRRVLPVYEVERRFGLKPKTLRGNLESATRQAQVDADEDYEYYRRRGDTCDLFTYWEVYSRMGFGNHLTQYNDRRQIIDDKLDRFGQYIFLAVSEDYEYPLNIPEEVCDNGKEEDIFLRSQWPTPFWADPTNPWPFVDIAFHKRPRKVWPMSHVKPALGEIRFLNWCFSFLAGKIKNTSRDFIATLGEASEELRTNILQGCDLTHLSIEGSNRNISEIVQFLQHPPMNRDIWAVMEAVINVLEQRLGLSELMYGQQAKQDRSATISQVKADTMRIRPDDMAECVESAFTLLSRKEAIAAFWHLDGQDVASVLGQDRAQLWDQVIKQQDLREVVTEMDYRIEAGSIRKPNRERQQENANAAVQQWGPFITSYFQVTGDVGPANDLAMMWKKAHDVDEGRFIFQPPPPQPNPEEMKLQLEQQKMQAELQMKQAEMQLKALEGQAELAIKQEESQMELALDAEQHDQEMAQDRERHLLDMLQARQEGQLKLAIAKEQGEASIELKKKQAAAAAKAKPKPSSNGSK